ncbi:amylo-alpha-1,6-glucosidase [Ferrigenium sp. UT5]|uniref:amylo-alpha-1,6-glucosidase n=1 Tax=Ferrigenium sp. UT5 TaxID=3242105 RepID=UPI003553AAAF
MKTELPQQVQLDRALCTDLAQAEQREWWLSDGKGGYAGGTVAGTLTRRYHGLLVAPIGRALQRHLLFAKADAELLEGERVIPVHTNRWGGGVVEPQGNLALESFRLDGRMPVWRYRLDDLLLEARIWMEHGRHSTHLAWRLLENPHQRKLQLRLRLMTNTRDHHGESGYDTALPALQISDHELDVQYPDCPTLHFHSRCGVAEQAHFCVENFDLSEERERGLSSRDRHLCVGFMTFPIHLGHWVGLTASIEKDEPVCYVEEAMRRAQARDLARLTQVKMTVPAFTDTPSGVDQLILASENFVLRIPPGRFALIAGYPWFGEWGRDSMIALPGLLLATGHYAEARELLLGYLPLVDRGMLPNWFPNDGDAPQYNTVDAALWYIEAWCAYLTAINDTHAIVQAWPVLQQIIAHYRDGTRHGIGMDAGDGLLHAGEAGVQLTWMDAKVGDEVITPRHGKPVEVNALWFNALQTMAQFAGLMKDEARAAEYREMAAHTRHGFQRFVRADGLGLYDVLDGAQAHDDAVRPNQIFAVSLPFSPLDAHTRQTVLAICRDRLLTPFGLRSLDPAHPAYRGRYAGDVRSRDSAYHQGTVWAWLLGHYMLAEYRVTDDATLALSRLNALPQHLSDAGLGTVSEIFDGDAPHIPRGAPSQAWSVACLLEAWWKIRHRQRAHQQKGSS